MNSIEISNRVAVQDFYGNWYYGTVEDIIALPDGTSLYNVKRDDNLRRMARRDQVMVGREFADFLNR